MFKSKLILAFLVCLGLVLRLYQVGELPRILNRDEAALAYNALLLKEVGQDEWGRAWPLALESFGDYKLPGYPLMLVGMFSILGYSDFATRLPSVLAGTALIVVAYWWARSFKWDRPLALVTSALVAVGPVFWFYSRMAFEANVALVLFTLAVGWWWFTEDDGYQWLRDILASGLLLVAIFTYNTPLLLLPFIIVSLPLRRGVSHLRAWLFPVVLMLGVGTVALWVLLPLSSQKSGITIFSDESVWMQTVEYRGQFSGLAQKVLGNKYVYFFQVILKNVMASLSPQFLVTKGGTHPWHQLPGAGHVYGSVYALGLVGLVVAVVAVIKAVMTSLSNLLSKKQWQKMLTQPHTNPSVWLLYLSFAALAPSVITVDSPHATRSLVFFFAFSLLAVLGLKNLLEKISEVKTLRSQAPLLAKLCVAALVLVVGLETENYAAHYFFEYPKNQASFQPGFGDAVNKAQAEHRGENIAVVDGGGYQYILTAWYEKLTPTQFFSTIVKQQPDKIGFKYGERVGSFHFIAKAQDRLLGENVVIEWSDETTQWEIKTF